MTSPLYWFWKHIARLASKCYIDRFEIEQDTNRGVDIYETLQQRTFLKST